MPELSPPGATYWHWHWHAAAAHATQWQPASSDADHDGLPGMGIGAVLQYAQSRCITVRACVRDACCCQEV